MAREQGFHAYEETIHHHAYLLLCQVFAQEQFEKLAHWDGPPDAFQTILACETPEFNKNIMTLAALARANDDAAYGLSEHEKRVPEGVGELTVGAIKSVLTAREACNKIIHAKSAVLRYVESGEHPVYAKIRRELSQLDSQTYQVPILSLSGRLPGKGGKAWLAEVNVIQWVIAVAFFAD